MQVEVIETGGGDVSRAAVFGRPVGGLAISRKWTSDGRQLWTAEAPGLEVTDDNLLEAFLITVDHYALIKYGRMFS